MVRRSQLGGVCGNAIVEGDSISTCILSCDIYAQANQANTCPVDSPYCGVGDRSSLGFCAPYHSSPPRAQGERCSLQNDCVTGLDCVQATSGSVCRMFCDPTGSPSRSCVGGQHCVSTNGRPDNVGHCE